MQLKSHFTLEVLEVKNNKYLLCLIKVKQRPITYYYKQTSPQTTHRWLQPHHWAEFDAVLNELLDKNELKCLSQDLAYHLKDSIYLKLRNSLVPVASLCRIITDFQIEAKDVINVIECSIEYDDSKADLSYKTDSISKLAVTPVRLARQHESDSKRHRKANEDKQHKQNNNRTDKTPQKANEAKFLKAPSTDTSPKAETENDVQKQSIDLQDKLNTSNASSASTTPKKSPVKSAPRRTSPQRSKQLVEDVNENKTVGTESNTLRRETRKRKILNYKDFLDQKYSKQKENKLLKSLFSPEDNDDRVTNSIFKANNADNLTVNQCATSTKKKKPNEDFNQEKGSINTWLSKKTASVSKSTETKSPINSPKKSRTKLENKFQGESPKAELEDKMNKNEEHIKWAQEQTKYNREVTKIIKELAPKSPERVEILDLMDLSTVQILSTFKNYRNDLDIIFNKNKSQLNINGIDGVDHYLIMELINYTAQLAAMEKLSEHYEKNDGAPPKYAKLFSMILMPEWILKIFMKRYGMKREKAISHLKAQNAYKLYKLNDEHLEDITLS